MSSAHGACVSTTTIYRLLFLDDLQHVGAATAPVYRAYNNGFTRHIDGNHQITGSLAGIQAVVARGWVSEGVIMCAPS